MKKYQRVLLVVLLLVATAAGTFSLTIRLVSAQRQLEMETEPVKTKVDELASLLENYFIDEYDPAAVATAAGDGAAFAMLAATGDQWSYYIPQKDVAAHIEQSNNAYVGIGVTIKVVETGEQVTTVTAGGPAEEAGILPGDIIVEVEGQSVPELGQDGTVNLVRGEEGTFVTIGIDRNGEYLQLEVERRTVVSQVATYEMLEGNIAWIRILNFDSHCAEHTLACVEQAKQDGAKAILFDVRFNGGGYKTELVELLDALLPEGEIFRDVDYAGKETVEMSDAACLELPMAVLVNSESYSAAEFFAAALQEYGVARVVGSRTSGKGNFQYTFDLSDGSAVAISCGKYFTPQGRSLTDVGIIPDVEINLTLEKMQKLAYSELTKEEDDQLQAALELLQEKVS